MDYYLFANYIYIYIIIYIFLIILYYIIMYYTIYLYIYIYKYKYIQEGYLLGTILGGESNILMFLYKLSPFYNIYKLRNI